MDRDAVLKGVFGVVELRAPQAEAVERIMGNEDVIVLFPTGFGKSICYQLPAVLRSGTTVVVCPLIALIHDQVAQMRSRGVECVSLCSDGDSMRELSASKVKLIYTTPEKLECSAWLRAWLQKRAADGLIDLLVFDEAHCICTWGRDFRPCYRRVGGIRQLMQDVPVVALTATATDDMVQDLKAVLANDDKRPWGLVKASFERPNLHLSVVSRQQGLAGQTQLIPLVRAEVKQGHSGLVYSHYRKSVVQISKRLRRAGVMARHYHAGLSSAEKQSVLDDWQSGGCQVVVATVAFGLGINKNDVRFVFHHCMPTSMLSYFQEVGRAGRDGLPASCVLLYSQHDFRDALENAVGASYACRMRRQDLHAIRAWCEDTTTCRHAALLQVFGEIISTTCQTRCNNCC